MKNFKLFLALSFVVSSAVAMASEVTTPAVEVTAPVVEVKAPVVEVKEAVVEVKEAAKEVTTPVAEVKEAAKEAAKEVKAEAKEVAKETEGMLNTAARYAKAPFVKGNEYLQAANSKVLSVEKSMTPKFVSEGYTTVTEWIANNQVTLALVVATTAGVAYYAYNNVATKKSKN